MPAIRGLMGVCGFFWVLYLGRSGCFLHCLLAGSSALIVKVEYTRRQPDVLSASKLYEVGRLDKTRVLQFIPPSPHLTGLGEKLSLPVRQAGGSFSSDKP